MPHGKKDQYKLRQQEQKVDSTFKNTPKAYSKDQIREAHGFKRTKSKQRSAPKTNRVRAIASSLKKQNLKGLNSAIKGSGFQTKNRYRAEDNKKIKKSKVKKATDPNKGGGGFMKKAQRNHDGRKLLNNN